MDETYRGKANNAKRLKIDDAVKDESKAGINIARGSLRSGAKRGFYRYGEGKTLGDSLDKDKTLGTLEDEGKMLDQANDERKVLSSSKNERKGSEGTQGLDEKTL